MARLQNILILGLGLMLATGSTPAATVNVVYNTPGDGFDSAAAPDPASPAPGATIGEQRRASFEAAADFWGFKLTSNVAIIVEARMILLSCSQFSATLGSAGATSFVRDWPGAPQPLTWYHFALGNKLADSDLFPGFSDVRATFNSEIGTPGCLEPLSWYYAEEAGAPLPNTISFFDVVLHEIGHGIGVSTIVNLATGDKAVGLDDIYMTFLEDHDLGGGTTWPNLTNGQRVSSAIDDPLTHWIGPAVQAAVGTGFLGGGVNNGHAMVYAPGALAQGSSISHFDTTVEDMGGVSEIMEPFAVTGATFILSNEMLEDLGWGPVTTVPVTLSSFEAIPDGGGVRVRWSTATEVGHGGFNLYVENGGQWQRLNPRLIVGSGDSLEPGAYEYFIPEATGKRFVVEDIDVRGKARRHSPFELGRSYGREPSALPINWPAIQAEHSKKLAARAARKVAGATAVEARVNRDGLHRITYEALAAAGLDLAGQPATHVAITLAGSPVARHINADVLGPGVNIDFYGHRHQSLYTATNVYRVAVDAAKALPALVDNQLPARPDPHAVERAQRRIDDNVAYGFAAPNGDPWYLKQLFSYGAPDSAQWNLAADEWVPGPAELSVRLWGVTDFAESPDHHLLVRFNDELVLDRTLDGREVVERTVPIDSQTLSAADNRITFELPGDAGVPFDLVNIESMTLHYRRQLVASDAYYEFEVEAGRAPAHYQLSPDGVFGANFESSIDAAFMVSGVSTAEPLVYSAGGNTLTRYTGSQVTAGTSGYNVTIAHRASSGRYVVAAAEQLVAPDLAAAAQPPNLLDQSADYLIVAHADFVQGIEPLAQHHRDQGRSVRVVDVADIYARYNHSVIDPEAIRDYVRDMAALGTEYVLLVGGDTYDYHDNLGLGSISFIPTPYVKTHPVVEYAPADPLLADTDGDMIPDLALGRLPVRNSAELDSVVAKTLVYPKAGHAGTALFSADRSEAKTSFSNISDQRIAQLPAGWLVDTAYIDELQVDGARQVVLDALNRGVALSHFFGHSGPSVWTFDGLFDANDAAGLGNIGKPTVAVQWGCWNAYYVDPGMDTMAHKLLLSGDRGAAAVLGAATLTGTDSDKLLGGLLLPRLMAPGATLGGALRDAKAELARTRPDLRDVVLGWTLLGDPALMLNSSQSE